MTVKERINVAVAVVTDGDGRVLLSRRPGHVHQGGLWEFPGGKIKAGESVYEALQRELQEELGIRVVSARPLITVRHDYPDRKVKLDVWRINDYQGKPTGCEEQLIRWVGCGELTDYDFPEANRPIVTAAGLPDRYLITPEPYADENEFLNQLSQSVGRNDIRLVQLRCRKLHGSALQELAKKTLEVCRRQGARLLINGSPDILSAVDADGLHLSSKALSGYSRRPCDPGRLLAASCHNLRELEQAHRINADFVVLSPVLATPDHPDVLPLGWSKFKALTDCSVLPVYALGGMTAGTLSQAWQHGGQGIAAIRAFWGS